MECIEKPINVNCDISIVNLKSAIAQFKYDFGFIPEWFNVYVSIEAIFACLTLLDFFNKQTAPSPIIYFQVNREYPSDYWSVIGFREGKQYKIYSEGA